MTDSEKKPPAALPSVREVKADQYRAMIARQRARYGSAYGRCADADRCEKARGLVAAAALFERDGAMFPTRLKKAAEVLKLAVFMLDPKAPA